MERTPLKSLQTLSIERFKDLVKTSALKFSKYDNPKSGSTVSVCKDDSGVVVCFIASNFTPTKRAQVSFVEASNADGKSQFWILNNTLASEDLAIEGISSL